MSFTGHVQNGVVVFDEAVALPEGTVVEVAVRDRLPDAIGSGQATHFEYYKEIIGAAKGLPEDFAKNHDHYIHGTPKQ